MELNQRIKIMREKKGYSQKALGDILGISKQAVSMYEQGKRTPDPEMIVKMSDVFLVDLNYMFGKENINEEKNSPEEPKLSEGEKMLLDLFRQVPEEQQQLVLGMIRAALNTKG